MSEFKKAGYMARVLERYGESAVKTQQKRIGQYTTNRTGTLMNTPAAVDGVGGNDSGMLVFSVVNYQRFLDMNLRSRIYNNIFGWYYFAIAETLQYGYGVEFKEALEDRLKT